jgi:hypothetical protein
MTDMDLLSIPYRYLTSLGWSLRRPRAFDDVQTFVLFIGYPRSAHSLIGFLLDAHPNIIVASQTSALKYLKHGFSKRQIFYVLLQNSRKVAKVGREWRPYSYAVPNQWQGRFEKLKVIGDSTGLTRMRRNPTLIRSLRNKLTGVELKLIHCIRHPYDNISTMKLRSGQTLEQAIERYFSMCETVQRIEREVAPLAVYDLKHEAVVADPEGNLQHLCKFVGVTADESYYRDCASIVYKSPHKSRFEVPWDQDLIDCVKEKMKRFRFLDGYCYED